MKWEKDTFGLVQRMRAMVYSSKDFNYVDFCRDSAKHASMMAFAAPKVESLWSDESLHYSHLLSRDSKSMEKDQLISMIHFLEERGKESERDNKELKEIGEGTERYS